jgi:hypothetical protein
MFQVLSEAVLVGIVTVIFGYAIMELLKRCSWFQTSCNCRSSCTCQKNRRLEVGLFLTGALLHIFFEVIGGNKYFCENMYSCKKQRDGTTSCSRNIQ